MSEQEQELEGMLAIPCPCPNCKIINAVDVPVNGYHAWQNDNMPIQRALPQLSIHEREQLQTGYCPECWDLLFGDDNET